MKPYLHELFLKVYVCGSKQWPWAWVPHTGYGTGKVLKDMLLVLLFLLTTRNHHPLNTINHFAMDYYAMNNINSVTLGKQDSWRIFLNSGVSHLNEPDFFSSTQCQFSIIIEPLFESYNGMVSTASVEDLCRSTLSWLDQHCSLPALRPSESSTTGSSVKILTQIIFQQLSVVW